MHSRERIHRPKHKLRSQTSPTPKNPTGHTPWQLAHTRRRLELCGAGGGYQLKHSQGADTGPLPRIHQGMVCPDGSSGGCPGYTHPLSVYHSPPRAIDILASGPLLCHTSGSNTSRCVSVSMSRSHTIPTISEHCPIRLSFHLTKGGAPPYRIPEEVVGPAFETRFLESWNSQLRPADPFQRLQHFKALSQKTAKALVKEASQDATTLRGKLANSIALLRELARITPDRVRLAKMMGKDPDALDLVVFDFRNNQYCTSVSRTTSIS